MNCTAHLSTWFFAQNCKLTWKEVRNNAENAPQHFHIRFLPVYSLLLIVLENLKTSKISTYYVVAVSLIFEAKTISPAWISLAEI
jgi:hypothetical protein